jgi:hypothetical protein
MPVAASHIVSIWQIGSHDFDLAASFIGKSLG